MSEQSAIPAGAAYDEGTLSLTICSETVLLHPDRAVIWPARRTVIVADTHFGKSALFRQHGLAVPSGSDEQDRERLRRLVHAAGAQRLIILGDFLHAPLDAGSPDALALTAWCAALRPAEIVVIAGNHDRGAWRRWRPAVRWVDEALVEPPFRFIHDAETSASAADARRRDEAFTMSGHVHPVARLTGLRKRAPRVPIFWQRDDGLVLPSFGIFTGGYVVAPGANDRVYAAGSTRVVRFR